jgi:hypothetical protein
MIVRSWVGVFVGAMFVLAAAGVAWGPLQEGHRATQLLRDTWPLFPVVLAFAGVNMALRAFLGVKVEVDAAADVIRIVHRAWHFGSVLHRTAKRSELDHVVVEAHHKRRKGRDSTLYTIELVMRDAHGAEERIALGGASSGSHVKAAFAQKLEAFIKQPG